MAIKDELRFRTQRFLTGAFNVSDLTALFLFLRGNSYGRQSVRDLGDMIGHADIRDRGLSVERVRDMQVIALFKMRPFVDKTAEVLYLSDAPATLLAVMDATFKLLGDEALLRETALTRNQIGTVLTRIKRKFSVKKNGNLFWDSYPITDKELSVVKCLTRFIIATGIYSAAELTQDTLFLLLKHGFIDDHQVEIFNARSDYISLFAVASLHGVLFDCPEGVVAEAEAGWATFEEKTYLNVTVTFPIQAGSERKLGLTLFDTDLHPSIWCEDYVEGKPNICFTRPIEITGSGKLRCMI